MSKAYSSLTESYLHLNGLKRVIVVDQCGTPSRSYLSQKEIDRRLSFGHRLTPIEGETRGPNRDSRS